MEKAKLIASTVLQALSGYLSCCGIVLSQLLLDASANQTQVFQQTTDENDWTVGRHGH